MAERRLIDVNDLIAVEWSPSEALGANGQIDAFERGMDKVIKYVKSMPTIEERKRGKWIWVEDKFDKSIHHLRCSECNDNGYDENHNYCPHCGAMMVGEEDNGTVENPR